MTKVTNEDINVICSGKFNIKTFKSGVGEGCNCNGELTYIGNPNKFHLLGIDLELQPGDVVEIKEGQIFVNGGLPKNKRVNFWLKLYRRVFIFLKTSSQTH